MTVCFLLRGDPASEVLLGYKKVRFGAGKYAGTGGGTEPGETPEPSAVQERAEEIGIDAAAAALRLRGRVTFLFPARPAWNQTAYVFTLSCWAGEPREGEEMRREWFPVAALPLERMRPDTVSVQSVLELGRR